MGKKNTKAKIKSKSGNRKRQHPKGQNRSTPASKIEPNHDLIAKNALASLSELVDIKEAFLAAFDEGYDLNVVNALYEKYPSLKEKDGFNALFRQYKQQCQIYEKNPTFETYLSINHGIFEAQKAGLFLAYLWPDDCKDSDHFRDFVLHYGLYYNRLLSIMYISFSSPAYLLALIEHEESVSTFNFFLKMQSGVFGHREQFVKALNHKGLSSQMRKACVELLKRPYFLAYQIRVNLLEQDGAVEAKAYTQAIESLREGDTWQAIQRALPGQADDFIKEALEKASHDNIAPEVESYEGAVLAYLEQHAAQKEDLGPESCAVPKPKWSDKYHRRSIHNTINEYKSYGGELGQAKASLKKWLSYTIAHVDYLAQNPAAYTYEQVLQLHDNILGAGFSEVAVERAVYWRIRTLLLPYLNVVQAQINLRARAKLDKLDAFYIQNRDAASSEDISSNEIIQSLYNHYFSHKRGDGGQPGFEERFLDPFIKLGPTFFKTLVNFGEGLVASYNRDFENKSHIEDQIPRKIQNQIKFMHALALGIVPSMGTDSDIFMYLELLVIQLIQVYTGVISIDHSLGYLPDELLDLVKAFHDHYHQLNAVKHSQYSKIFMNSSADAFQVQSDLLPMLAIHPSATNRPLIIAMLKSVTNDDIPNLMNYCEQHNQTDVCIELGRLALSNDQILKELEHDPSTAVSDHLEQEVDDSTSFVPEMDDLVDSLEDEAYLMDAMTKQMDALGLGQLKPDRQLQQTLGELQAQSGELLIQAQTGKQVLDACRGELATAQKALEGLKLKLSKHQQDLKATHQSTIAVTTKAQNQAKTITLLQKTIKTHQGQLDDLNTKEGQLRDLLQEKKQEQEKLEQHIAKAVKGKETIDETIESQKSEIKLLESSIAQIKQAIQVSQEEMLSLSAKRSQLQGQIQALVAEHEQTREKLQVVERMRTQREKAKAKIGIIPELERKKSEYDSQANALATECDELKQQGHAIHDKNCQLEQFYNQHTYHINQLKGLLADIHSRRLIAQNQAKHSIKSLQHRLKAIDLNATSSQTRPKPKYSIERLNQQEQQYKVTENTCLPVPETLEATTKTIKALMHAIECTFPKSRVFIEGGFARHLESGLDWFNDIDLVANLDSEVLGDWFAVGDVTFTKHAKVPNLYTHQHGTIKIDLLCQPDLDLVNSTYARDFRCNTLFVNKDLEKIDVTGHAVADIHDNKFIAVKGQLEDSLSDDPIRILRLLKQAFEMGWPLTPEYRHAIKLTAPGIHRVALGIFEHHITGLLRSSHIEKCQLLAFLWEHHLLETWMGYDDKATSLFSQPMMKAFMQEQLELPYGDVLAKLLLPICLVQSTDAVEGVVQAFLSRWPFPDTFEEHQAKAQALCDELRGMCQIWHEHHSPAAPILPSYTAQRQPDTQAVPSVNPKQKLTITPH